MKLRLQHNSLRLRLKQGEVAQLAKAGRVEEKIIIGGKSNEMLIYTLQVVAEDLAPHARIEGNSILVQVSARAVNHWVESEEISIEEHQPVSEEHCLHLLIEKDFACLDGTDEQNADTFPHPLAGTKC